MVSKSDDIDAPRSVKSRASILRWLLALLAASTAAAVILRLQTFLYVPWEAKMRGVETAYAWLADAAYWSDAVRSLAPLSLTTFLLSLPFAIAVSGLPELRGEGPRTERYAVAGGLCPLFWAVLASGIYHSLEFGALRVFEALEASARPELGFLVIAGVCGGYGFGRMRLAFR